MCYGRWGPLSDPRSSSWCSRWSGSRLPRRGTRAVVPLIPRVRGGRTDHPLGCPFRNPSDEDAPSDDAPVERSSSAKRRRKAKARQQPVRTWRSPTAAAAEEQGAGVDLGHIGGRTGASALAIGPCQASGVLEGAGLIYFEPLVALAIVVLLLVSLWAYTGNGLLSHVVESKSMQHGPGTNGIRLIPGILSSRGPPPRRRPQPITRASWYRRLDLRRYGDVILYYPNGLSGGTPNDPSCALFLN